MAGFDYAKAGATALRLLDRFGAPLAIRRQGPSTGDPWAPIPGATTDHPGTGCVIDYTAFERAGTQIEAGERKALVAAKGLAVTPSVADRLVWQGEALEIVEVKPLAPAGVAVIFEIRVRT